MSEHQVTPIEALRLMYPDAADAHLEVLQSHERRTGLSASARQIYLTTKRSKRKDGSWEVRTTVETTIDGHRLTAQRTGEYQGQDGPHWCGTDGEWRDVWLDTKNPPEAARVGVYRNGFVKPIYAVANWDAYAQTGFEGKLNMIWAKMGPLMLSKCAEALALRKAFPAELSGLYTSDEMQQAGGDPIAPGETSPPPPSRTAALAARVVVEQPADPKTPANQQALADAIEKGRQSISSEEQDIDEEFFGLLASKGLTMEEIAAKPSVAKAGLAEKPPHQWPDDKRNKIVEWLQKQPDAV